MSFTVTAKSSLAFSCDDSVVALGIYHRPPACFCSALEAGRASANGMGALVIRALAAGALTGDTTRHPVAVPTVAPIGSGRDYGQDLARSNDFRFLLNEGYVDSLVEASLRFVLGNPGVSGVLVGFSSLGHLEQALDFAARGPLPQEAIDCLPQVWSGYSG